MQHRTLRRVVLSFAVVIVAVGSLTLLSCSGGGEDGEDIRNVNTTIPLDALAAANNTTAILNGDTFTGISGAVLVQTAVPAVPQLASQTFSLSFSGISGATGQFVLTAPNVVATGNVTFAAACTFKVATTNAPAVLPVGTTITISNCSVTISATGVPVGSTTGTAGTVTLNLNGFSSQPFNTTVMIQDNGALVVLNGTGLFSITVIVLTGTSGG